MKTIIQNSRFLKYLPGVLALDGGRPVYKHFSPNFSAYFPENKLEIFSGALFALFEIFTAEIKLFSRNKVIKLSQNTHTNINLFTFNGYLLVFFISPNVDRSVVDLCIKTFLKAFADCYLEI